MDAQRQLSCVLLQEPWRMVLLDMAEGEEADGAAGDGEDKAVENMEDDEDTGEKGSGYRE